MPEETQWSHAKRGQTECSLANHSDRLLYVNKYTQPRITNQWCNGLLCICPWWVGWLTLSMTCRLDTHSVHLMWAAGWIYMYLSGRARNWVLGFGTNKGTHPLWSPHPSTLVRFSAPCCWGGGWWRVEMVGKQELTNPYFHPHGNCLWSKLHHTGNHRLWNESHTLWTSGSLRK